MRGLVVGLVCIALVACAAPVVTATPSPAGTLTGTPAPSASASAVPSAPAATAVPALTVQDPTVRVSPSTGLRDGETVTVAVTGFGVGAKVWLSECASASDVSGEGCGAQLAAQTLLATGDDRSGSTTFVVHRDAATQAVQPGPTATCTNGCVIVATQGPGYGDAWAAIGFGP